MRAGRVILLAGLPAGLGTSTVALALADALAGLGRAVLLVAPLAALGEAAWQAGPARMAGPACVLGQGPGPGLVPLELSDEQALPAALPALAREADFIIVDRFTGLRVADSPWHRAADDLLLLVDGRPGMDTRALLLAGHILRHWPDRRLMVLHTRMKGPFNWQTAAARFLQRLARHHGAAPCDLGCLPEAPEIARAAREGKPFTRLFPNHPGSRQMRLAARQLVRMDDVEGPAGSRTAPAAQPEWARP